MYFKKAHRKDIIVLNVVALIDVSSILIIFLIMGTIFGETAVFPPNGLELAKSSNKDTVQSAPQLTIFNNKVQISIFDKQFPLAEFHGDYEDSRELGKHKNEIKAYIGKIPIELKKSGVILNVVTDRKTPYRDVFDVIKFYRQAGFESVLFIALGD